MAKPRNFSSIVDEWLAGVPKVACYPQKLMNNEFYIADVPYFAQRYDVYDWSK